MWSLAGLLVMAGVTAGCSSSAGSTVKFTDTPENISYASELRGFDDLGSMTATSDLVVKATVTEVVQGRTSGTAEDGGATTTREVRLRIDKVIYQRRGGKAPESVLLAEGYWDQSGTGYMVEGLNWSKVGDTGYYFLSGPDDTYTSSDHYALVWSQGRVVVTNDGIAISGDYDHEGPWVGVNTSAAGVATFEASLAAAAEAARTGKAKVVKPEMCARAPEMAACKG